MPAMILFAADYHTVDVIRCSPPSWTAHAVLEEKRADYEVRWLSFAAGEHRTPEMLARNPRGTIPVLVDGDQVVHETLAIVEFLDQRLPAPPLMPRDRPALALTRLHESANLKNAGMAVFGQLMRGHDASAAWDSFRAELAHWERVLDARPYVAGPDVTLADFCVFTYVATARTLGLDLAAFPAIAAFVERFARRPSIAATWPATWG